MHEVPTREAGVQVRVSVNGIDIQVSVEEHPGAPWLLCLHSLATDLAVWDHFVRTLGSRRSIVRFDFRGHGQSLATPPPYDLSDLVADSIGVLDGLGIREADVIGLSIGGMVAMGIGIARPDRVRRVVVANSRASTGPQFSSVWDTSIADALAGKFDAVIQRSTERWFSEAFRTEHPEAVAELAARAMTTSLDGFIGCARAVQGVAYLDSLHNLTAPTLFITGELDPAAPPDIMRDMSERVPQGSFEMIPGAAHLSPLEAPDAFESIVIPFLLDGPSGAAR